MACLCSVFEREFLVETIKQRLGVDSVAVTSTLPTAVSSATPFQRYVKCSLLLLYTLHTVQCDCLCTHYTPCSVTAPYRHDIVECQVVGGASVCENFWYLCYCHLVEFALSLL